MKRRALLVLLLLVAGAIVNVAVAWGCVLWSPLHQSRVADTLVEPAPWWSPDLIPEPGAESLTPLPTATFAGIGVHGMTHGADLWGVLIYRSGFPLSSFEHAEEFLQIDPMAPSSVQVTPHRAISIRSILPWRAPDTCYVPRHLLWPGFAINTVFYAGVLWLLFAAPFALRRRRRIKRGLCPKCGYPVGTNKRCTECGATHASSRNAEPGTKARPIC